MKNVCWEKHNWIAVGGEAKWVYKEGEKKSEEPYVQMGITRFLKCSECGESKIDTQQVHIGIEQRLQIPY